MDIFSLTDIGVGRKENQDNYWSALLNVDGKERGILCVCDGMGGLKNGGLASSMVINAVKDYLLQGFEFDDLLEVLCKVNADILAMASSEDIQMGTTCTILCVEDGKFKVWHIGDSRAYIMLNGVNMRQLTTDHSAINKYQIKKSEDPELWNRFKNKLTRCIGVTVSIAPEFYEGTCSEGDSFLICSDGLWHYLEDHNVSSVEPMQFGQLINGCIADGETDNITVCMLKV